MASRNPKNERIKKAYADLLENAKHMSPTSVDQVLAALAAFEKSTKGKDFAAFKIEQARRFKTYLEDSINEQTGKPLAVSTIRSRLMAVKAFFQWLAVQSGYRRKITYADCEYFNLSANDTRIATAVRPKKAPTLEQVHAVIAAAPSETIIQRRDRALVAFALLTGMRDMAIATMRLGLVDLEAGQAFQDARDVDTKNRKTMLTTFFPVGGDCLPIVTAWVNELTHSEGLGQDDPLFPATYIAPDDTGLFAPAGLSRQFWTSASPIRAIFRELFARAGYGYFNPHSLRQTLAKLGEQRCTTAEQFKAWSQNLGHEQVLTTFRSYGAVSPDRQREIIAELGTRQTADHHPLCKGDIEQAVAILLGHASSSSHAIQTEGD